MQIDDNVQIDDNESNSDHDVSNISQIEDNSISIPKTSVNETGALSDLDENLPELNEAFLEDDGEFDEAINESNCS